MKKNIIQLNGRLYDAETGKMLQSANSNTVSSANPSKPTPSPAKKSSKKPFAKKSIDGFGKFTGRLKPKSKTQNQAKVVPKPVAKKDVANPVKATRQHPNNQMRAQLQHTSTLRRSVVKKPISRQTKATIKQTPKDVLPEAKHPNNNITSTIKRSPLISRFTKQEPANFSTSQPKSSVNVNSNSNSNASTTKIAKLEKPKPDTKVVEKPSAKEALIANGFKQIDKNKRQANQKSSKRQKIHHHVKKHRKTASIAAGGLAVLLIGLYVIYLNVPNMAIKFAASRAGFDASLPHYSPSGYSFNGPIKYQPGQVAISFKSNSDSRKYSVVEQPSRWDSEAVYDNYVSKQSNKPPYTIQDSGLTIYLFGKSSAAWVNGGKFFAINGSGSQLSNQQLLSIATSL